MSTPIRIVEPEFFNLPSSKENFISGLRIGRTVPTLIAHISTFYNPLSSTSLFCFHTCHESSSFADGGGEPQLLLLSFPPTRLSLPPTKIDECGIKRTIDIFPKLVQIFNELASFINAKNKPTFELVYFTKETIPVIIVNFENCMEWISCPTQKLMLLKFIRSFTLLINKNNPSVEEIINNILTSHKEKCNFIFKNYFLATKETLNSLIYYFISSSHFNNIYEEIYNKRKQIDNEMKRNIPLKVWSRHPSHAPLRNMLVSHPTILRFGYRLFETPKQEEKLSKNHIIINPFEGIKNSASKFKMKHCFENDKVKTAVWCIPKTNEELNTFIFKFDNKTKFIVKSEFGSRGDGLILFDNAEKMITWFNTPYTKMKKEKYGNYLVEKYYSYNREYRLHVTSEGCFYTCRKMLKEDVKDRWFRNDSNSVWIVEENEMFQKPLNWKEIEQSCVKALQSVGLDVGACDVRVQSARDNKQRLRENPDYIICEINSAPGLGEVGLRKYRDEIHKIISHKLNNV